MAETCRWVAGWLFFYRAGISGNASDVIHLGVAHLLKQKCGLSAAGAGVAVDKQRDVKIFGDEGDTVKVLQGDIVTCGDMALTILLWCAHIQQNGAGGVLIFRYALIDIGLSGKTKETHM